MSWRRFCGWEPRVTTTYEYDPGGRLVRSVTTTEAEWDDTGRAAALALRAYEADLCPGCKQPLTETAAHANMGRYAADLAIRCHRCTATEIARKIYEESPQAAALLIPVGLRRQDEADGSG